MNIFQRLLKTGQSSLGRLVCLTLVSLISLELRAEKISIDIIGGNEDNRYPLFLEGFEGEENDCVSPLTPTIKNDLIITGFFNFTDASSAKATVTGNIQKTSNHQCKVHFAVYDTHQKLLVSDDLIIQPKQSYRTAHRIADMIYYAISGFSGIFDSRIAYVRRTGKEYFLEIADVDGGQPKAIFRSYSPIMSPAWSPDGKKVAYVSFEKQKAVVYAQDLVSGKRQSIANFKGSNSAPSWSPDGTKLAVTLTLHGNSQIYLINANGESLKLLTSSQSIDTEASWSPDGKSLIFVSDRSGQPQIYRIFIDGSEPKRLTFDGYYNVSPKISPNNQTFTYINRKNNSFRVMVQDFDSRFPRVLSDSYFNERPSFSPNGQIVLYSSEENGKSVLYAATVDGGAKTRIGIINSTIQDPSWGPIWP